MSKFLCILVALALSLGFGSCRRCDHVWQEADCRYPRTCTICGRKEGEALGHQEGTWEETSVDIGTAEHTLTLKCVRCDEVLKQRTEALDNLVEEGYFTLAPLDFGLRMESILAHYLEAGLEVEIQVQVVDGLPVFTLFYGEDILAEVVLLNRGSEDAEEKLNRFDSILTAVYDETFVKALTVTLMQDLEPALTPEAAAEQCRSLVEGGSERNTLEHGGIAYTSYKVEDRNMIDIRISK